MRSTVKRNGVRLGLLFAAAIVGFTPPSYAQDWIRQFGTQRDDSAHAVAPDGAGGIFIGGRTSGDLGGPSAGDEDAFLARYDGSGNQLWIRQFGTETYDMVLAAVPDGLGGVIATGWMANYSGQADSFLTRYDSEGNRLWFRQLGTDAYVGAYPLVADGAGGAIVGGSTSGSFGGPHQGGADAFLARYDAAGDQLWVRQFGTSENEQAFALSTDGVGGVMIAGETFGELGRRNRGGADAFIARFDLDGNQSWLRQFGTRFDDEARSLAPDGVGGVIAGGHTFGSWGGQNQGYQDIFLTRYDNAGNRLWRTQFGTDGAEYSLEHVTDGAGGVVVGGYTTGNLGGPNAGGFDAFLAGYDGEGHRLWIRQFGTLGYDYLFALAPYGVGGAMVAGQTNAHLGGYNSGGTDVFLARFSDCDPCDMNCDAVVDPLDIEPFLEMLFGERERCFTCTGDVNDDGAIDASDIQPFLDCLFPWSLPHLHLAPAYQSDPGG